MPFKQLNAVVLAAGIAFGATLAPVAAVAAPASDRAPSALPPGTTAAQVQAASHLLPPPAQIAGDKREAFAALGADLMDHQSDRAAIPAILDAALAKLPEPTMFRGFVQMLRAAALQNQETHHEAEAAADESVRLLPGYSGPLITASEVYSYSDHADVGADYLLRAIAVDPASVRHISDYDIRNLFFRLNVLHDVRRTRLLGDQLLAIDWLGHRLGSQSGLAQAAIKRRLGDRDVAGARALVSKLFVPGDSFALLQSKTAQPLWSTIEHRGGARLTGQWTEYLQQAADRWKANPDATATLDYVAALSSAGHYRTIVRDILPSLSRTLDPSADSDLLFVATSVASALAHVGRWADADALFVRLQTVWPLGSDANALNITANRARYLLLAGRANDAVPVMNQAIADATHWGEGINADAVPTMNLYRACALHELGRDAEVGPSLASAAKVPSTASLAYLQVCMGRPGDARDILIAALGQEATRDSVVAFMQPNNEPPLPSAFDRRMTAGMDALRRDPALIAAIAPYGRILPFSAKDGAPAER